METETKTETKTRGLSPTFIEDLTGGSLAKLLVRIQNDNTLDLQIRQNYINVYYRGGNVFTVTERDGKYYFDYDPNYGYSGDTSSFTIQNWIDIISDFKQQIDSHLTVNKETNEREFQQLVVRENNYSNIANSTDYFIVDIEYDNRSGARMDLIAIEWLSETTARKLASGYKPRLVFIEKKYGDGAIDGSAGMIKHIEDFIKLTDDADSLDKLATEMLEVFKQKRMLGLITGLKDNDNELTELDIHNIDFAFLLANHDPAKSKLDSVIGKIKQQVDSILKFNIKFLCSNFFGYGLYKDCLYDLDSFKSKFGNQIIKGK